MGGLLEIPSSTSHQLLMIPCNNFEQQRIPHPRLVPTASQQFKFIRLLPLQELPPQQVRWQRTYRRLQPQYRTEVLAKTVIVEKPHWRWSSRAKKLLDSLDPPVTTTTLLLLVSQVRAFAHVILINNSIVTGVTDSLPEASQTYIFESKRTSILKSRTNIYFGLANFENDKR